MECGFPGLLPTDPHGGIILLDVIPGESDASANVHTQSGTNINNLSIICHWS